MKKLFFNPFEKYTESTLFVLGLLAILGGSCLGFLFNGRFDGVIDLHFSQAVSFSQPFIDNFINSLSLFVPLLLLGRYINKKTRPIDIITTVLIARLPFYLLALTNIEGLMYTTTTKAMTSLELQNVSSNLSLATSDITILLLFAGCSILLLAWFAVLLYNGFKVATNTRGTKNIVLFAVAIIVAEILSKIIILNLNY